MLARWAAMTSSCVFDAHPIRQPRLDRADGSRGTSGRTRPRSTARQVLRVPRDDPAGRRLDAVPAGVHRHERQQPVGHERPRGIMPPATGAPRTGPRRTRERQQPLAGPEAAVGDLARSTRRKAAAAARPSAPRPAASHASSAGPGRTLGAGGCHRALHAASRPRGRAGSDPALLVRCDHAAASRSASDRPIVSRPPRSIVRTPAMSWLGRDDVRRSGSAARARRRWQQDVQRQRVGHGGIPGVMRSAATQHEGREGHHPAGHKEATEQQARQSTRQRDAASPDRTPTRPANRLGTGSVASAVRVQVADEPRPRRRGTAAPC